MSTHDPQSGYPGHTLLSDMLERIKEAANVRLVFGDPVSVNERTFIPVATIVYGFGAGSGGGHGPVHDGEVTGLGGGGGGGGFVRVQPVAVLEVSASGTKVRPIIDWTHLAVAGLGLIRVWLRIALRRKRKQMQPRG
jgi:uncharacterized spore protein YtfJ